MKSKIDIGKDKSLLLKDGTILDITNGKTIKQDSSSYDKIITCNIAGLCDEEYNE